LIKIKSNKAINRKNEIFKKSPTSLSLSDYKSNKIKDESELINTLSITEHFINNKTDENDPRLIEFVASLIKKPNKLEYNLIERKNEYYSQNGQDQFIDNYLNNRQNGFFVQVGAHDEEIQSNTIFFELQRNWSGLVIEPIPKIYERQVTKKRKCYTINACISERLIEIRKFINSEELAEMGKLPNNQLFLKKFSNIYYAPCFSLSTILKAINITKIDYFSLEVEGNQVNILKSFPFKSYEFETFTIKHNGVSNLKKDIEDIMFKNNYTILKDDFLNFYFGKRIY
jgi:hypothetical protein